MPTYVRLPNGKVAVFPDGMAPEEIDRILQAEDQRALVPQERSATGDFEAKTVQGLLNMGGGGADLLQPDAAPPISERTRPLELMAQQALRAAPAIAAMPVV